ncbi:MAG: hypothetical protein RQ729_13485, partial [Wenzhouxiangellaceae bacterium]|nr:hypothetical protein [Wenzhouxiangellaceae bacterium]
LRTAISELRAHTSENSRMILRIAYLKRAATAVDAKKSRRGRPPKNRGVDAPEKIAAWTPLLHGPVGAVSRPR